MTKGCGLVYGGDEKAPYGGGGHDAGGEAGEGAPEVGAEGAVH